MKTIRLSLWCAILLVNCPGTSTAAEPKVKLPDRYGEVVLKVEGMT